ncbi:hypothetical protein ACH5RR_036086 [Cinchona calisaya]|uniref:Uncharacterized protein n=1 Tax=Cinchona calisaya TaxID=153742 RepID=A0ABD2Y5E3_9GENT
MGERDNKEALLDKIGGLENEDEVQKGIESMSSERREFGKEKRDIALNKKQLGKQLLEMRKDIDELVRLSEKLKDQQERILAEIEHDESIALLVRAVELLEKVSSYGTNMGRSPTETDTDSSKSGGHVSSLRKCTLRIFNLAPSVFVGGGREIKNLIAPLFRYVPHGTVAAAQASIDSRKRTEATEGRDDGTLETATDAEVMSGQVLGIASDNQDAIPLVQLTPYNRVETQENLSNHVVRFRIPGDADAAEIEK